MNFNETHPLYRANVKYWNMVRTFIDGKDEVRNYISTINPSDQSIENLERNTQYKAGAVYMNVSSRTRNALVGAVMRKDPQVEVPPQIDYLLQNADGSGRSLNQVAKGALNNVITIGRHGLLVDFPYVEDEMTMEKTQQTGVQAKICQYTAETIVNWDIDDNGVLESVTLLDSKDDYRVLKYDENGLYIQELWDDGRMVGIIEPRDFTGKRWDTIPFTFVCSETNTPEIDHITLLDIVNVSRGHLQNSADYEDLLHHLLPTFAATVPNAQWMKDVMPDGYRIGARGFIPIPEGGTAMLLQPTATQVHAEAMKQKEDQMVLIGARLISSGQAAETAEAVKIRYSGENSVLDAISQNVSEAIEDCLEWVCRFMGGDPEKVQYELNREFFETTLSAQEIMALIQMGDAQIIAKTDITNKLRKAGIIESDRTDEDIQAEIGNTL